MEKGGLWRKTGFIVVERGRPFDQGLRKTRGEEGKKRGALYGHRGETSLEKE